MQVVVGAEGGGPALRAEWAAPDIGLMSREAHERLVRGHELHLPWDIALALLEHAPGADEPGEDDDSRVLPEWLCEDDVEVLSEAVQNLQLPPLTDRRLKLAARGSAGRAGFELTSAWVDEHEVPTDAVKVRGGLLQVAGEMRRMSLSQWRALQRLPSRPLGRDRPSDTAAMGQLRAAPLLGDPSVILDPYLQRRDVLEVPAVAPRIEPVEGGRFQARPRVEGMPDAEADEFFYKPAGWEKSVHTFRTEDGKKRTAVFSPRAVAGLKTLQRVHNMDARTAARAMTNPVEVFGDALDLSQLSDRVVGIGPAVHRPVPILRELSSVEWFDWDMKVELSDPDDETAPARSLDLSDDSVLESIEREIKNADDTGAAFIPHPKDGGLIELNPALRQQVEVAREKRTAAPPEEYEKAKPKEVLLVRDNLEDVGFDRSSPAEMQRRQVGRPPGLAEPFSLRGYQTEGVEWLASLYDPTRVGENRWQGALLADDMGLGKTLQVLSFLSWLKSEGAKGPNLLVAPVGLLTNWEKEADRFFGSVHQPFMQVRGRDLSDDHAAAARKLSAQQFVAVSYATLRRHEFVFARVKWNVVVLDEAQKAKNPGSQISRVVRTLDARFRLAMTGTPVENTLKELWCIYDWAVPGLLGSLREFAKETMRPLIAGDASERRAVAERLHSRVKPVFVRRLKEEQLEGLPPISHKRHEVAMSDAQQVTYTEIMSAESEKPDHLGKLIRLFGVTAHPSLRSKNSRLPNAEEVSFPKAEATFSLLDDIRAKGEKAILFANRRAVQEWLQVEIARRYGIAVDVINGQISDSKIRMRTLDRFAAVDGFGALVLAPKAAGVGLNITAANHVIHYTREWNPALEKQATDRAYRFGQERPVFVHTLVCTSSHGVTVDERLDALLAEKSALMNEFVVPMGGFEVKSSELGIAP